jgi:hypothetical protein
MEASTSRLSSTLVGDRCGVDHSSSERRVLKPGFAAVYIYMLLSRKERRVIKYLP